MANAPQALSQHWVHSHEEDTDTQQVFRPATWKFPLSRGRRSFDLRPDGIVLEQGPGPADRTQSASGRWRYAGKELMLESPRGAGKRCYHVESIAADKLVLRRDGAGL